jgi:hypothetical protein
MTAHEDRANEGVSKPGRALSLKMLANGEATQYPMLTQVMNTVATNHPDQVNDIGFFALPGKDASKNGATVWMPLAFFIPKTSKHIDVAKDFFAFVASTAGTDAITAKVTPADPYLIKGAKLPENVLPFVNDLNGYIDSGNTYPAVVDAEGAVVRHATHQVTLDVSGVGKLLAIGSANPVSEELYLGTERAAYEGRLMAVVQSTGQAGTIHIRAMAEALAPADLRLAAEDECGACG